MTKVSGVKDSLKETGRVVFCATLLLVLEGAISWSAEKGGHVESSPPFELSLVRVGDLGLRAVLRNSSAVPQVYCHNEDIQPSELVISDHSGRRQSGASRRTVLKLNPVPSNIPVESCRSLRPGEEAVLTESSFRIVDRTEGDEHGRTYVRPGPTEYSIDWGDHWFNYLEAGRYSIQVAWRSRLDPSPSAKLEQVPTRIWKGVIMSSALDIELKRE